MLDLLLVAVMVLAVVRGWRAGLARAAFSVAFLVVGLVAGALLAPLLAGRFEDEQSKVAVTLVTVLGAAVLVGAAGEAVGSRLSNGLRRLRLGGLDSVLGAAFGFAGSVLAIWLAAGMLATTSIPGIGQAIEESRVVQEVQERLPPSPPVIARIERLLDPLGFPRVFAGLEPDPGPPVAPPGNEVLQGAVDAAAASTLRIEAEGCGGLLTGSGFVAAPDLVVTNAHVVAGTRRIAVVDGGTRRAATPVAFDPDTDVAVLQVGDLSGVPLALATEPAPRGTGGAILGYPGGGPLTVGPGAVLDATEARGRDIYNQDLTRRSVYVLQGQVRPGSSGGPFVLADGRVAGVVFARSQTDADVAYALTAAEVAPELAQAATAREVSTGACAAE